MASSGDSHRTLNIVHGTYSELIAFLVLNMWPSHLGLPLLLAVTILSKRVHRHATFLNLCVVFIIVGISSSILVYDGSVTGPEPAPVLCLFQASLLYGMPAGTSVAVFALVFQMFVTIRASFKGVTVSEKYNTIGLWLMIISPYFAWMGFILATASVGALHPNSISRSRRFFYCSVENNTLTNTLTTVAAIILFATLVLEVWTLILFYKRWSTLGHQNERRSPLELNMPIRVLAFGLYLIIAFSLSLLSVSSPSSPVPDLVIAFAATAIILIFGTQPDILHALCFWKKAAPTRVQNEKAAVNIIQTYDEPPPLRWSHRNIPRI